jgi:histidinol-phosphate aminotransferase
VPTQVAGTAALAFRAEMEARVAAIVAERERVIAALAGMDGLETFPSGANFILFRPQGMEGHALWEALLRAGVLVRDFSRWPRLDGCLRVTIGRPDENETFLTALKEAMA